MAKKKDGGSEEVIDVIGTNFPKKHKKHKHKKHKKKKGTDQEGEEGSGYGSPEPPLEGSKPALKLKIKIGGQTFGEKSVAKNEIPYPSSEDSQSIGGQAQAGSDDEEEAWLEAVESGRLEEVDDELKRMKDPTLMTARQRALLESKSHKEKEEPVAAVPEKELTEEMIKLKMLRAKKRKQQAEEKREKDKKQTIERLLKKTDAKIKGIKKPAKRTEMPKVTYVNNQTLISVSLPTGIEFPMPAQSAKGYPCRVICGVNGCRNAKKYNCSKTGVPLCSLECYKKNFVLSGLSKLQAL